MGVGDLGLVSDHPDAAAAPAGLRLEHHGAGGAEGLKKGQRLLGRDRTGAGRDRHTMPRGEQAGLGLVSEHRQRLPPGTDEGDPGFLDAGCEGSALRQEPIARMNRITAGVERRRQQAIAVEVGGGTDGGQRVGLVCRAYMQRRDVVGGVDRNRLDSELLGGPDDAKRDLAAIGNQ